VEYTLTIGIMVVFEKFLGHIIPVKSYWDTLSQWKVTGIHYPSGTERKFKR